jgi:ATP-dependent DNA ligase
VKRLQHEKMGVIEVATKEECKGMDHMQQFLQDIIDEGGEGIILRDPFSPYLPGRCPGFLKHKV